MSKLPQIKAKDLIRILDKLGFAFIRQKGSHMFFRHADGRTTTVPNHPAENIDRGLFNKIIRKDLEMEREEVLKYL
ncbi:type II toxin-antitoxin system HicA family toxin [Candidatus Micrarchaeota archaeon]|nr:type II toxin-antitoxin system HicA family toxin [Candidatus Micrarchaeota archaeon]